MPDESCRAFDSITPIDPGVLQRFLVGVDAGPRQMSAAEVDALGDPFARLLIAQGTFPRSAEAVVESIKAAVGAGTPLKRHSSFILGEGSQLSVGPKTAGVDRSLRFVVTIGSGPDGPDIFLSAFDPKQPGGIELMAWDRNEGGFNFYRSTGPKAIWMFAGNSRDALRDATRGKGPFESHRSGALLMKELKSPWINWHSPDAGIAANVFAAHDRRRTHEWFKDKEPTGGLSFEAEAARPAISRWADARFSRFESDGGNINRPTMIIEQILTTPTVNIATTHVESGALQPTDLLDLPTGFFIDAEGLSETLGLEAPPFFTVSGAIYAKSLEKFDSHLSDGTGFRQKGDTHFCFLALERAFEDQVVLRKAITIGLLTRRLAACLLMVDPWNPIFSGRRRALLAHLPATALIANAKSSFSDEFSTAILDAAAAGPTGTPEAEFAERWAVGTNFSRHFNSLLKDYYRAVKAQLRRQAGFDSYFRLAAERRRRFASTMPIAEFSLLLPVTDIAAKTRSMQSDGTVREG